MNFTMNFAEAEALIFRSYNRVGAHLRGTDAQTRDLAGMERLFARANVPTCIAPAITVTGSKGKGSTSLISAALLQGMGHRVGLLTSPHLLNLRERIRLNGRAIPEADFVRIVAELAPHIDAVEGELAPGKYLSPTGLFLAVAARYFTEQAATALVLEVGRGGRYDDVRLMRSQVACFTPILGEHLDKLGPTLRDIGWHKSGIIQPGSAVISAPQADEPLDEIRRECAAQGARLALLGRDVFCAPRRDPSGSLDGHLDDGQRFQSLRSLQHFEIYGELFGAPLRASLALNTPALYQAVNVGVAAAAVAALTRPEQLSDPGAAAALARLRLPGRCERLSEAPLVFVDGAINGFAARWFRLSVEEVSRTRRPLVLVTALPDDKDAAGLLAELAPHADQVIVTRASAGHLHFSDRPLALARQFARREPLDLPEVNAALGQAVALAGAAGAIWAVGTQSFVRDALRFWRQDLETVLSAT